MEGKSVKVRNLFLAGTLVFLGMFIHIATRAATAARSPFVVVLMPDTQYYSLRDPATYNAQTEWIAYHKNFRNIRFVIHLGDITHTNTLTEWQAASAAHDILDNANVPYSVIPGNHDNPDSGRKRDTKRYNQYFGPQRFDERAWYGGHFRHTNDNNYCFFEVHDLKFMIVNLEFAPSKEALCWADSLLLHYPDRRVIVATHCYQGHDAVHQCNCGTAYDIAGSGGNTTWNEFVRRHSNIFMVVSGHVGDSELMVRTGNLGNTVYEILTDYQFEQRDGVNHGNGWLRTLEFFPDENRIDVRVLSVLDDVYEFNRSDYPSNPNDPAHNYSLDYDMSVPVEGKYLRFNNTFNDMTVQASDEINQSEPAISMAPNGDFITTWQDSSGNGTTIKARGFRLSGKPKFPAISIFSMTDGICHNPDVAVGSEGQYVVVWEDNENGDYDIRASGFNETGQECFSMITINSTTAGNQISPSVTMTSDSTFIVVWEDDRDTNGKPDIMMTEFDLNGNRRFDNVRVNVLSGGPQRNPDIVVSSGNSVIVTWESDNDNDGLSQIRAVVLDDAGTEILPEMTVNANSGGQHQNPSIDVNSAGDFIIAWEDDSDGNGNYEIHAAGFNDQGEKLFGDVTINIVTAGQQLRPSVALAETGDFVVAFQDDNDGNGYYQIYAAEFNADGSRGERGVFTVNENAGGQQFEPVVALHDPENYVILWEDDMNNNGIFELLAKGYDYSESYITRISQDTFTLPEIFTLHQNYPNPFNGLTKIGFSLCKAGTAQLRVYNYLGEEVAFLVNRRLAPGTYTTVWNPGGLASGIYLYELRVGSEQITRKMMLVK